MGSVLAVSIRGVRSPISAPDGPKKDLHRPLGWLETRLAQITLQLCYHILMP